MLSKAVGEVTLDGRSSVALDPRPTYVSTGRMVVSARLRPSRYGRVATLRTMGQPLRLPALYKQRLRGHTCERGRRGSLGSSAAFAVQPSPAGFSVLCLPVLAGAVLERGVSRGRDGGVPGVLSGGGHGGVTVPASGLCGQPSRPSRREAIAWFLGRGPGHRRRISPLGSRGTMSSRRGEEKQLRAGKNARQ